VHSYFFAITDTGEAIVFHSPTTNGGVMYLKPTENTEIQAEFKRLVEEE
jgi:putative lipoprotein